MSFLIDGLTLLFQVSFILFVGLFTFIEIKKILVKPPETKPVKYDEPNHQYKTADFVAITGRVYHVDAPTKDVSITLWQGRKYRVMVSEDVGELREVTDEDEEFYL